MCTLYPTRTYHKYEGKSFVRRIDVEIALTVDFPLPIRNVNTVRVYTIRVRQENEIEYEPSRSNFNNFTLRSGTMRHSKSLTRLHKREEI